MSDLIYLAVIVGFFAAAFALLRACERIIGPDLPATTAPTSSASTTATGTGTPTPDTGTEPEVVPA